MRIVTAVTNDGGYRQMATRWLQLAQKHGDAEVLELHSTNWRRAVWEKAVALCEAFLADPTRPLLWVDVDGCIYDLEGLNPDDHVQVRVFVDPKTTAKSELAGTIYIPATPRAEAFVQVWRNVALMALRGQQSWCSVSTEQDLMSYALGVSNVEWRELPKRLCRILVHDGPGGRTGIEHGLMSKMQGGRGRDDIYPPERQVHVMMPCWGDGRHLAEVLDSVEAQTYRNFAMTLHFDGPTYGRIEVLADWLRQTDIPVRVQFSPENRGTAAALNRASEFGIGARYVTWIANDDLRHPDWLKELVRAMDQNPGWGACFSAYDRDTGEMRDGQWHSRGVVTHRVDWKHGQLINDVNCPCGPSFLWRMGMVAQVGPHRGVTAHDYDYWLRLEEKGHIGYVPKSLATYRVHDQRCTVLRRSEYDAPRWQQEARARRLAK